MWMISAITHTLIEHPQKDFQDRVFFVLSIGTTVDIEQDDFRAAVYCRMDITKQQAVIDFVAKKFYCGLSLAIKFSLIVA